MVSGATPIPLRMADPGSPDPPVRVRLLRAGHHLDVDITVHDPHAIVADLVAALGGTTQDLVVDGRTLRAGQPLDRAHVAEGSLVALADAVRTRRRDRPVARPPDGRAEGLGHDGRGAGPRPPAHPAILAVRVVDGFDCGARFPLPLGRTVLGRADVADPTVSRQQFEVVVAGSAPPRVIHLASTNATTASGGHRVPTAPGSTAWPVGSILNCGAARLALETLTSSPGPLAPAVGASTRPLHRTPRPAEPPSPPPLRPPPTPEAPSAITPVGVLGVVASVAVGAVMVAATHSWMYGLFALLGPVLMVANGLESRRRHRKDRRCGDRRRRRDMNRFEGELAARSRVEAARRLDRHPGPGHLLDRVSGPIPRVWDRRADHIDAFAVRLGTGGVPWVPPVVGAEADWPPDVAAAVGCRRVLAGAAVGCHLDPGSPIALVGPRVATTAVARSLVAQAAVDHGPADLGVAVVTSPEEAAEWAWTRWLPHILEPSAIAAARTGAGSPPGSRRTVVVVDDPNGIAGRDGAARAVVRAATDEDLAVVPIVLVERPTDVPAACTTVIRVDETGRLGGPSWLVDPTGPAALMGIGERTADEIARRLARYDDPEWQDDDRSLPPTVELADLLPIDPATPGGPDPIASLAARWLAADAGADPPPVAVLGRTAVGPLEVDLTVDGPHALVAGTTGSGKSELLRTLVASLAIGSSPDHITFALVDFKGGSAFDACARLPHVTGVVTDLDAHLAARALRCLEAEIRHREARLRHARAPDLAAFRRAHRARDGRDPLPRLVVVVDEFATLAAELPDFVDGLVGIAQRGRSLGIHLVLATQRPAGSVSDNIRANTDLRIALRVQDGADSRDVIDRPDAADLPRHRPGRALARVGSGEVVAFQAARVTGPPVGARPPVVATPVDPSGGRGRAGGCATPVAARPDATGLEGSGDEAVAPPDPTNPDATTLAVLAATAAAAWLHLGGRPPRRPWPDPLPDALPFPVPGTGAATGDDADSDDTADAARLIIGLADDPDHQRQVPFAWDLDSGPLLAVGLAGSGPASLAATAVLAAVDRWSPEELHVHVIDFGGSRLGTLAALPHVGAVIGGHESERQRRVVADLANDLLERLARRAPQESKRPRRLLIVHGLGPFRDQWDDLEPTDTWARFMDVVARGTPVGIHVLVTSERVAVPQGVLAACRQRLVFRLADRADHAAFGLAPTGLPALPPGRGLVGDDGTLVQIAQPPGGLVAACADRATGGIGPATDRGANGSVRAGPAAIGVLPDAVSTAALAPRAAEPSSDGTLVIPLGLADHDLATAGLELPPSAHALVAGPARSGRTTALRTIAAACRATEPGDVVTTIAVTSRPAEWTGWADVVVDPRHAGLVAVVDGAGNAGAAVIVLVDDADAIADDHAALASLLEDRRPRRHVVVAARADRLRARYGHWAREAGADRIGLLAQPDPDLDGELLGVALPRRTPVTWRPGRAWLVGPAGQSIVQVAVSPT